MDPLALSLAAVQIARLYLEFSEALQSGDHDLATAKNAEIQERVRAADAAWVAAGH